MRRKSWFGLMVCFGLTLGGSVSAQQPPTSGQRLALYTKPAVVRILGAWVAEYRFNNRTWNASIGGMGSGFFISPDGYIATNAHVVSTIHDGEDKAKEALFAVVVQQIVEAYKADFAKMTQEQARKTLSSIELAGLKKINYVVLPNGEHAAYDIKAYGAPVGEGKDCAVIKIPTRNAPTLPIGDSSKVQIQDRVFAVGYPGVADVQGLLDEKSQLEASITDGAVSAMKTVGGDQVIQVSTPITHGNSGGPALNEAGEVIGLATFGNLKLVQGFNFLVSSATLLEFVRQAGASHTPSETDRAWRRSLELFWDRRYTAAIEELQEVTSLFPAHVEAQKLLAEARELKRAGKERSSFPVLGLVGGGVALLLAGASAFLFVRAYRSRSRAAAGAGPARAHRPPPLPPALPGRGGISQPVPPTIAVNPGHDPTATVPQTMFAADRIGVLTVTRGKLAGERFTLTPEGVLVGRQPGVAHIVVNDGRASGEHVWIRWEDGKLWAIDQNTTNGTFVNDVKRGRISRAELKDGDVLIVADPECCSLTVKLG